LCVDYVRVSEFISKHFLGLIGQLRGLTQQGERSNMGAASHWPSSRTGNDNRLPGSTEGNRLLVSSAFDLEFWDKLN